MKHAQTPLQTTLLVALALCLWTFAGIAAPTAAQEPGITLGLSVGLGGSVDEDVDYSNFSWQVLFAYDLEVHRTFSIRAGQLEIESDKAILPLRDATLSYITLGGDFHFPESFYRGGLFLGLGYYDLDSDLVGGGDSAVGLTLGTTADFKIRPRWSLLVEFSAHFADLDAAQFFVMTHAGIAWRF